MSGSEAFAGGSGREWKSLYLIGGAAALAAMAANILDVVLGFGGEVVAYGAKSALDWFAVFGKNAFAGLYALGLLNIVYQICMIPVFAALAAAHARKKPVLTGLSMIAFFVGVAVYLANSAAVPMSVLSGKYASAGTEFERALIAAAGESVLARGEDFTPGAFLPLILQGIAALGISFVILKGGVFKKPAGAIGIIAFSLLAVFTFLATFVPSVYTIAFYGFGMLGGLFVLAWFVLIARGLFRLGKTA